MSNLIVQTVGPLLRDDGTGNLTALSVADIQGPPGAPGANGRDGATGPGVPTGGGAGQVLRKSSGTDYDAAWSTLGASDVGAAPAANGLGVVAHGTNSSATRPTGYSAIVWVGSVDPANKVAGDLWIRSA